MQSRPTNRSSTILLAMFVTIAILASVLAERAHAQFGPGFRSNTSSVQLVPASFKNHTDSQGFLWNFNTNGQIQNGTDNCFSGACVLTIQGSSFSPSSSQRLMTRAGNEYVLTRSGIRNLTVTRRIKVDSKAAAVRYVETLHNPTTRDIATNVMILTSLARSQAQTIITNTGRNARTPTNMAFAGTKDEGALAWANPSTRQLAVLFYFAGPKSKLKPTMQNNSNVRFTFTYPVTVKAGKSVSIVHGIAQRRLASVPTGRTLDGLFKPFRSRDWLRDLPTDVRRSIVNLGPQSSGLWETGSALTSLDALDVQRGASDILAFGDRTRLHGTLSFAGLEIETAFGKLNVPLEKVAAIVGGKHAEGKARIFLRDGQTFSGKLKIDELRFTMNTGLQLELGVEKIDRLVTRADPDDGKPAAGVFAMLQTVHGDSLALLRSSEPKITATTPWGKRQIAPDELIGLSPTDDMVGHQLALRDGSRIFAFLSGAPLKLKTLSFGPQTFKPLDVRQLLAVQLKETDTTTAEEVGSPHVVLSGDNVLVGQIDLANVHLLTAGERIPIPPNQIRLLKKVSDTRSETGEKTQLFEAQLWDGGVVSGVLQEVMLPFRTGDVIAKVPARDVMEVHVPTPTVPEALRERIAGLIRELGDAKFKKRDSAAKALAELGNLAKLQLNETLRQTSDVEVRRRVRALLEELE